MKNKLVTRTLLLGIGIWLLAAIFYLYEFVQRIALAVMVDGLMSDFNTDATSVGHISASYYYTYAILQVPAGFLFDKYNYKFILVLATLTISFGSLLLADAHTVGAAYVARAIIGAGSAFGFTGCLKVASIWLPNRYFPFIVGLTTVFAVIGAQFANAPLAYLVETYGWRFCIEILTILGIGLATCLSFIPKSPKLDQQIESIATTRLLTAIKHLIYSKDIWLLALYGGLVSSPIVSFSELWSIPFLQNLHQISKEEAASINVFIFYGMATGAPILGWLASHIVSPKKIMLLGTSGALICLIVLLYIPTTILIYKFTLFSYGVLASNMLLCFSIAKFLHYDKQINVLSISFTNMVMIICGSIFQPIIGKFISLELAAAGLNIIQINELHLNSFRLAFSILPICLFIALLICTIIKNVNLNKYK